MTTKDKINEALGLSGGKTIDEMLEDMSIETKQNVDKLDELSDSISEEMKKVDDQIRECNGNMPLLNITSIDASMKEVEDLIVQSKDIFKHIADNIMSSELLDAELIGSASKLLESIHINIAEFISLYRDKQKYVDKIRTMLFQQNLKKELMDIKHKQTLELLKMKAEDNVVDTTGTTSSGSIMTQEDITKMLSKMSGSQLDDMIGHNLCSDQTNKTIEK